MQSRGPCVTPPKIESSRSLRQKASQKEIHQVIFQDMFSEIFSELTDIARITQKIMENID